MTHARDFSGIVLGGLTLIGMSELALTSSLWKVFKWMVLGWCAVWVGVLLLCALQIGLGLLTDRRKRKG